MSYLATSAAGTDVLSSQASPLVLCLFFFALAVAQKPSDELPVLRVLELGPEPVLLLVSFVQAKVGDEVVRCRRVR